MNVHVSVHCPDCHGTGARRGVTCTRCDGTGNTSASTPIVDELRRIHRALLHGASR